MVSYFSNININSATTRKHFPEIERGIQVIKDRSHYIQIKLPYKCIPKWIIIELIIFFTMWIDTFPVKIGVSDTFSPQTIMTVMELYCQKR